MAEEKKVKKKIWPVAVTTETKYRASVIAALFNLTLGDVLDRAVVCYANALRLSDKMEQEFPRQGIDTPERTAKPRRPPNLHQFAEHAEFWKNRTEPS